MLPKENRLRKGRDFEKVFKEGRGFKEDFLFFKKVKNDLDCSRFGFLISKNFSKKAALRNKMKRRLRELVKMKLNKVKKGVDVVLVVSPGLEKKDFWEIEEILSKIFEKADLLKT